MVEIIGPRDYTQEELRDKERKNGGVRLDSVRQGEVTRKLHEPRGDTDLKREKLRAAAYDKGCISPLPRDKDGKASYMPDIVGQDKMQAIHRATDGYAIRSNDAKIARQLKRNGVRFSDYENVGWDIPNDPLHLVNAPKVARKRADSPFKRAGKAAASVIIVRKG